VGGPGDGPGALGSLASGDIRGAGRVVLVVDLDNPDLEVSPALEDNPDSEDNLDSAVSPDSEVSPALEDNPDSEVTQE